MAKFGHVLISGIVTIVIAVATGVSGSWLTTQSGSWSILGWPICVFAFGYAGISALHVWRISSLQMKGMRMMRDDPKWFEEAKRRYQETIPRNDPAKEKLIPLLNGIVRPLQQGAVPEIDSALQHIPDGNPQGRFMILLMHVCLASILHRLDSQGQSHLSSSFKDFAISQWDRPPEMTVDSDHKLFAYSQQQLRDTLVSPNEEQLEDVGLTLLSITVPDQEHFTAGAALACGQTAHACWQQASVITQHVMEA